MTSAISRLRNNLTHDRLIALLAYDMTTGVFRWRASPNGHRAAGDIAGCLHSTGGYLKIGIDGSRYYAHRLAWFYVNKVFPLGLIDHHDGNTLNNAISNLRLCCHSENNANRNLSRRNSLGKKGVTYGSHAHSFKAQIMVKKKHYHLGYFDTVEAAHAAYMQAANDYFGEFAFDGERHAHDDPEAIS